MLKNTSFFYELFTKDIFKKFDNLLMLIIIIAWIVAIVFGDFINGLFVSGFGWGWLYDFASHVIVLGVMLCLND